MEDPANKRTLEDVLSGIHNRLSFGHHERIDVHTRSFIHDTPLHLAAREGDLEAVALLLEAGADPNAKGDFNATPLHEAVLNDHHQIVSLLLAHGASASEIEATGMTPASMASLFSDATMNALFRQ